MTEFCRVITKDGLSLEGLLFTPHNSGIPPHRTWLLIHGTGSNFYALGVLEAFADLALQAGHAVLRVNTRGHDAITRLGGRNAGAAYETISECRSDIAAWVKFLEDREMPSIGLVGHSMGAVKAIYAQANDGHPAVGRVVAISPPRFCHARFAASPDCARFREDEQRAQKLVREGRGEELIAIRQPLPMWITAESFLAKYGPHDDYDIVKHLDRLNCPTLILMGSVAAKSSPAFAGVYEEVQSVLQGSSDSAVACELIEDADVGFSACLHEPFHRTQGWLRSEES